MLIEPTVTVEVVDDHATCLVESVNLQLRRDVLEARKRNFRFEKLFRNPILLRQLIGIGANGLAGPGGATLCLPWWRRSVRR